MDQDDFNPEDHGIEYDLEAEFLAKQHFNEMLNKKKEETIKKDYKFLTNHYNRKYLYLALGEDLLLDSYNKIIKFFESKELYEKCKEVLEWKTEVNYLTNF